MRDQPCPCQILSRVEFPVVVTEREKVKAKASSLGLRVEPPAMEEVRAWEEELARIEVQSRRSSSGMLGLFGLSRKRTAR